MSIVYYCSKCGNKLADNVKFCSNCGQGVVMKGQTPQPETEIKARSGAWTAAVVGVIIILVIAIVAVAFIFWAVEESKVGTLHIEVENHSGSTIIYYCEIDDEHKDTCTLASGFSQTSAYKVKGGTTHIVTIDVVSKPSQMKSVYVPERESAELAFDIY